MCTVEKLCRGFAVCKLFNLNKFLNRCKSTVDYRDSTNANS